MEPQFLLIAGVIALAVVGAIIGHLQAAKRKRELTEWAAAHGYTFTLGRDGSFDERFPMFERLRQGSNRYAYHIARGQRDDRPVLAFDYHYETYSRDNKGRRKTHHHHFSAVILDAGLPLKPLDIRPEGIFDKVTAFFGKEDINFELDAFSRAFHVQAPDRQWAFDVLHQATMEFLLAQPRFRIEIEGRWVMLWTGRRFGPKDFDAAMSVGAGILDRLPRYLVNELRGQ